MNQSSWMPIRPYVPRGTKYSCLTVSKIFYVLKVIIFQLQDLRNFDVFTSFFLNQINLLQKVNIPRVLISEKHSVIMIWKRKVKHEIYLVHRN